MELYQVIEKYDIDNEFKRAVSKMLSRLSKEDIIEQLSRLLTDMLYVVAYDSDIRVDDGSNVLIAIREKLQAELTDIFDYSEADGGRTDELTQVLATERTERRVKILTSRAESLRDLLAKLAPLVYKFNQDSNANISAQVFVVLGDYYGPGQMVKSQYMLGSNRLGYCPHCGEDITVVDSSERCTFCSRTVRWIK